MHAGGWPQVPAKSSQVSMRDEDARAGPNFGPVDGPVNNQLTTQLTGWFFLLTVTTGYCFFSNYL